MWKEIDSSLGWTRRREKMVTKLYGFNKDMFSPCNNRMNISWKARRGAGGWRQKVGERINLRRWTDMNEQRSYQLEWGSKSETEMEMWWLIFMWKKLLLDWEDEEWVKYEGNKKAKKRWMEGCQGSHIKKIRDLPTIYNKDVLLLSLPINFKMKPNEY